MSAKACACAACVKACETNPGWFAPGEAEKAADLLGMGFAEFRDKFLVREYWVGGAHVYAPRRTCQPEGFVVARWSDNFMEAPCVFLTEEKRCRIHSAKPFECRETASCDPCHSGGPEMRDKIQKMWQKAGAPLGSDVA